MIGVGLIRRAVAFAGGGIVPFAHRLDLGEDMFAPSAVVRIERHDFGEPRGTIEVAVARERESIGDARAGAFGTEREGAFEPGDGNFRRRDALLEKAVIIILKRDRIVRISAVGEDDRLARGGPVRARDRVALAEVVDHHFAQ